MLAETKKKAEARKSISKLLMSGKIEFNTGTSSLSNKGKDTVSKLANILKKYPDLNIEIAGHTDSDGSKAFNTKLSQSRVDNVKKELISKGVSINTLTAKGYGESRPLVPNTTRANKQKNRRVELNIIGE